MWALSLGSREERSFNRERREVDFIMSCQEKPEDVRSWKQGIGGEIFMDFSREFSSMEENNALETERIFERVVRSVLYVMESFAR